jgi:hypothetical protein
VVESSRAAVGVQAFCYAWTVSGWGCRHQYEEQCLRLLKECKPGMPGCVLFGKVVFIDELAPGPGRRVKKKRLQPRKGRK